MQRFPVDNFSKERTINDLECRRIDSVGAEFSGLTFRITAPRPGLIGAETDSQRNRNEIATSRDRALVYLVDHTFCAMKCVSREPIIERMPNHAATDP
jgi:hypothetical protein